MNNHYFRDNSEMNFLQMLAHRLAASDSHTKRLMSNL